jgi:hypothetical protein
VKRSDRNCIDCPIDLTAIPATIRPADRGSRSTLGLGRDVATLGTVVGRGAKIVAALDAKISAPALSDAGAPLGVAKQRNDLPARAMISGGFDGRIVC